MSGFYRIHYYENGKFLCRRGKWFSWSLAFEFLKRMGFKDLKKGRLTAEIIDLNGIPF